MNLAALDQHQYGLLFDVRRSIRYHDRRRAFFERLHKSTGVLTIMLAGGVLFEIAGTGSPALWLQGVGVLAAGLASLDIVVGYAARANQHAALRARFIDLEMQMLSGELEDSSWQTYRLARLAIERDEPPIYRALDLLCRNEMLCAEGYKRPDASEHYAKVGTFQRLTSQLAHWSNIAAA